MNRAYYLIALAFLFSAIIYKDDPKAIIEAMSTKERFMKLTSAAFKQGETIPARHTCEGDNISPALLWMGAPAAVKSFALIADDPDAPAGTWVHWVIYNIPPEAKGLPEAVPDAKTLEDGSLQGVNDFKKTGYGGPCPPKGHGSHRYFFKLYALNSMLNLDAGVSKPDLEKAIKDRILGRADLIGRYERK